jgi:translation elongation factor EF-Tu-like GTPase
MGWKFWQRDDSPRTQTWPQDRDTGVFRMTIEDVFSITGRGTVVTGRISSGAIQKGSQVTVSRNGQQLGMTTVTGIEKFRAVLDEARMGDNVGLLLDGVQRDQVVSGDVLSG